MFQWDYVSSLSWEHLGSLMKNWRVLPESEVSGFSFHLTASIRPTNFQHNGEVRGTQRGTKEEQKIVKILKAWCKPKTSGTPMLFSTTVTVSDLVQIKSPPRMKLLLQKWHFKAWLKPVSHGQNRCLLEKCFLNKQNKDSNFGHNDEEFVWKSQREIFKPEHCVICRARWWFHYTVVQVQCKWKEHQSRRTTLDCLTLL